MQQIRGGRAGPYEIERTGTHFAFFFENSPRFVSEKLVLLSPSTFFSTFECRQSEFVPTTCNLEASIESEIGELWLICDSQVYPCDRTQKKLIDLTTNDSN
jgi:hypothetical protein